MAFGSARTVSHKGLLFDGGIPCLMNTQFTVGTDENKPVKFSANKTVSLCSANDLPDGIVISIGEGICTVQMTGFVTVAYTGSAPTYGRQKLEADGAGAVRVDDTYGREYLVTDVDTSAATVTFLIG